MLSIADTRALSLSVTLVATASPVAVHPCATVRSSVSSASSFPAIIASDSNELNGDITIVFDPASVIEGKII